MTLPDTDRPLKDGHQDGPFAEKPRDPVYRLLDLMARIAGLRLKERWSGWNHELFTSTSSNVVSVFGR